LEAMHFQSPDANSEEQARIRFNDKDKKPESIRGNPVHSTHEQQIRIRAHEIYLEVPSHGYAARKR